MRHLTFALIALAAIFAAACGSSSEAPTETADETTSPTVEATQAPSIADVVANAEQNDGDAPTGGSTDNAGSGVTSKPGGQSVAAATRPTQLKIETPERKRLVQAVESTTSLEAYEFEFSLTLPTIPDLPSGITMGGAGAIDPQNERFAMTMDFSDLFTAIASTEDMDAAELDLMSAFLGEDPMEIRHVDGVTYINWALFGLLLGADAPWIAFEDESSSDGFDSVSSFGTGAFASPQDAVEFLRDVWGVEEVGRETIRGVETTHYRGVIDFETMLTELDVAQLAELESELGGASLGEVFGDFPIDVWIDDNDVMRRFTMEMDFSSFGSAGAAAEDVIGSMFMSYDFFNIGGAISIVAPPASEVSDVSDSFLDGFDLAS